MKIQFAGAVLFAALAVAPLAGQTPDGTDINKAIPIYFGQTVTDTTDGTSRPNQVYSIVLARGQQLSIAATGSGFSVVSLLSPESKTLGTAPVLSRTETRREHAFTYNVASAGTYFIWFLARDSGVSYTLRVTAVGTPIAVPNPASAGCLNGRVDSITYSLQLIAAGLADEVVIGGARACTTCQVKAPLYPEIVNRIETAMRSRLNVEACYDSSGGIFQIKLIQP